MNLPYNILHTSVDLDLFQASFDDLHADRYLDSSQRCRALSRYSWEAGVLTRLPERLFFQSSDVNGVEGVGGVDRTYPPIADDFDELPGFTSLIAEWLAQVGVSSTTFSVHQIRTQAGGDPAPEGPHRDGYEFIGIFVVDRCNLSDTSGATSLWTADGEELLLSSTVIEPGQLVTIDDQRLLHDATPVVAGDQPGPSHRDVLILTLPDHGYVADHGEFPAAATEKPAI